MAAADLATSACGTKRTCALSSLTSATDPKREFVINHKPPPMAVKSAAHVRLPCGPLRLPMRSQTFGFGTTRRRGPNWHTASSRKYPIFRVQSGICGRCNDTRTLSGRCGGAPSAGRTASLDGSPDLPYHLAGVLFCHWPCVTFWPQIAEENDVVLTNVGTLRSFRS